MASVTTWWFVFSVPLRATQLIRSNAQTSLLRALSPTTPTYVFPAMNTLMYEHPLTSEHIRVVRDVVRYEIVGPIGKALACGDVGTYLRAFCSPLSRWFFLSQFSVFCDCYSMLSFLRRGHWHVLISHQTIGLGAMSEWRDIVQIVVEKFRLYQKEDHRINLCQEVGLTKCPPAGTTINAA
jgi:phosphopantothenoylcysteine synthetase/decarboxylase